MSAEPPATGEPSEPDEPNEQAIERLITRLVQRAPESDPAAAAELIERLQQIRRPLARSIARIVELTDEQLINPGIALPALAMACATLAAGVRGELSDRELEAARNEIETLTPMPDRPPTIAAPDVPLASLKRR